MIDFNKEVGELAMRLHGEMEDRYDVLRMNGHTTSGAYAEVVEELTQKMAQWHNERRNGK